jgi:hypothetical protein
MATPAFENNIFRFKLDTLYLIIYGIISFGIIFFLNEINISSSTACFFSLAIIYSLITISLSNHSIIFVLLEILFMSAIIEIFAQLDYEGFSWFLAILLPSITMAGSLYYLIFYLSQ